MMTEQVCLSAEEIKRLKAINDSLQRFMIEFSDTVLERRWCRMDSELYDYLDVSCKALDHALGIAKGERR